MRIGVVVENNEWQFFREIFAEIEAHHQVSVFAPRAVNSPVLQGRINRRLLQRDLDALLAQNDVVFFEWAGRLLAQATQGAHRAKIVTRLHRFELYERACAVNWQKVERIITVSEAKKRELVEKYPACEGKTVVIPSAVLLDKFFPEKRPFKARIGTVCDLFPRKRVYELVLAFYALQQRGYPDATLHIAGGPRRYYEDYAAAIEGLIAKLQLQERVRLYGRVEDTAGWYRNLDIFVSHAYSEGLPASLLEAMASGCYCLAHFWEGAEEALPAEQLYATDHELVEKISAYCERAPAQQEAAQACMRAIASERFDLNQTKVQVRQLLESILPGPDAPA